MASITSYRTDEGQKKYLARITLKGFRRTSRSFDSQTDAKAWPVAPNPS